MSQTKWRTRKDRSTTLARCGVQGLGIEVWDLAVSVWRSLNSYPFTPTPEPNRSCPRIPSPWRRRHPMQPRANSSGKPSSFARDLADFGPLSRSSSSCITLQPAIKTSLEVYNLTKSARTSRGQACFNLFGEPVGSESGRCSICEKGILPEPSRVDVGRPGAFSSFSSLLLSSLDLSDTKVYEP